MTESLISPKQPDRFTSESPIRAFTEFRVDGLYAIGKGFRPSLAHIHTYLHAMWAKEGWKLVQMLDGGTLDPTLIFQKEPAPDSVKKDPPADLSGFVATVATGLRQMTNEYIRVVRGTTWPNKRKEQMLTFADRIEAYAADLVKPKGKPYATVEHSRAAAATADLEKLHYTRGWWSPAGAWDDLRKAMQSMTDDERVEFLNEEDANSVTHYWQIASVASVLRLVKRLGWEDRITLEDPEQKIVSIVAANKDVVKEIVGESRVPNVGDDPINPAYYDGTACAEIIEHMPTNVGIAAKYGWRLGEKDAEEQECGKAAWYLKRELALHHQYRAVFGFSNSEDRAWYRKMADDRIEAARKGGKLTDERALFMTHLVSYTITGHVSLLHQAIGFLESQHCFGNGLAI